MSKSVDSSGSNKRSFATSSHLQVSDVSSDRR